MLNTFIKNFAMGSRKKKSLLITEKNHFFNWYRSLNILDKIAFKSFLFNYCRGRINLLDVRKYHYFWQFGPITKKRMINVGYNISWQ